TKARNAADNPTQGASSDSGIWAESWRRAVARDLIKQHSNRGKGPFGAVTTLVSPPPNRCVRLPLELNRTRPADTRLFRFGLEGRGVGDGVAGGGVVEDAPGRGARPAAPAEGTGKRAKRRFAVRAVVDARRTVPAPVAPLRAVAARHRRRWQARGIGRHPRNPVPRPQRIHPRLEPARVARLAGQRQAGATAQD